MVLMIVGRVIRGESPRRGQRLTLAAQLRGHVQPRLIAHWQRAGWHVHRIGQAAYVHSPDERTHLILGVWADDTRAPAWSSRLGTDSEGYRRRAERCARDQHGRRFLRDTSGRFFALLPWWRTPGPRLYRWLDPAPSLFELERGYR